MNLNEESLHNLWRIMNTNIKIKISQYYIYQSEEDDRSTTPF